MFDLTTDLTAKEKFLIEEQIITCTLTQESFYRILEIYISSLNISDEDNAEICLKISSKSLSNVFKPIETYFCLKDPSSNINSFFKYLSIYESSKLFENGNISIKSKNYDKVIYIEFEVVKGSSDIKIKLNLSFLNHILFEILSNITNGSLGFVNPNLGHFEEAFVEPFVASKLTYETDTKFTFLVSKYDNHNDIINLLFTPNFGSVCLSSNTPYYEEELTKIQKCNLYYNYQNIKSIYYRFELGYNKYVDINLKFN